MNSSITLTHLYLRHYCELRNFLLRRVGCREIATELTQETFIRVMVYPGESILNVIPHRE